MSTMLSSILDGLRRAGLVLLVGGLAGLAVHAGGTGNVQVQAWSPMAIGNSILVGILVVVGLIVLAIPTGIVGVVGVAAADAAGPIGWVVVGLAVVVFVIAAILLALVVSVPVQTYLRYYALCILGDTNEAFDLIAERRQVAGT